MQVCHGCGGADDDGDGLPPEPGRVDRKYRLIGKNGDHTETITSGDVWCGEDCHNSIGRGDEIVEVAEAKSGSVERRTHHPGHQSIRRSVVRPEEVGAGHLWTAIDTRHPLSHGLSRWRR